MKKGSIDTQVENVVSVTKRSGHKSPTSLSGDFGVPTVVGVKIGPERSDLLDTLKSLD
jgi:hypothetical protein